MLIAEMLIPSGGLPKLEIGSGEETRGEEGESVKGQRKRGGGREERRRRVRGMKG